MASDDGQLTQTRSRTAVPTTILPPLTHISQFSPGQISSALERLRGLYWPSPRPRAGRPLWLPQKLGLHKAWKVTRLMRDESVPDSGYASAEEEESHDRTEADPASESTEDDDDYISRADTFERKFAITWLTGFIARSDTWLSLSSPSDENERYKLIDDVTSLLSLFAGDDTTEGALIRRFSFPFLANGPECIEVELNDAPLSSEDHTSVGLQSWASSIVLAERMCARPAEFGLLPPDGRGLQVLELGAGTGLLSIVAAKLLQVYNAATMDIMTNVQVVATDYHPDVLTNLTANIRANFNDDNAIDVHTLDWEYPSFESPLDDPFNVILAADVIYHPEHARWIKGCVERYLLRPGAGTEGGVF